MLIARSTTRKLFNYGLPFDESVRYGVFAFNLALSNPPFYPRDSWTAGPLLTYRIAKLFRASRRLTTAIFLQRCCAKLARHEPRQDFSVPPHCRRLLRSTLVDGAPSAG